MSDLSILCADVGSVVQNNFAWAAGSGKSSTVDTDTSIENFAERIAEDLRSGIRVAVGFECPLFVPVRDKPSTLTRGRNGEGNRPWSAGAGAAALCTGLVEMVWVFRQVRTALGESASCTFDWKRFTAGDARLFLWEAFVSGQQKRQNHEADARAAVDAFRHALPDPSRANKIDERDVLSLVGVALMRAGWPMDQDSLSRPCLVIRA